VDINKAEDLASGNFNHSFDEAFNLFFVIHGKAQGVQLQLKNTFGMAV
jgi:hypothetical protein